MAAVDVSAGATVGVEYRSNPFEVGNDAFTPVATSVEDRGDVTSRLSASVSAETEGRAPLRFQVEAALTREIYSRFDTLTNNQYRLSGGLDWTPGPVFDASLEASQSRAPGRQADIGGQETALQTTRQMSGTLRVRPTPRWQIGLTPARTESETPVFGGTQDLELRENSATVALGYLGVGRLVPGVAVSVARGRFSGVEDATRYEQQSIQGTLDYKLSDFSTFSLAAGGTQRDTSLIVPSDDPAALANEGDRPVFTGSLTLQRRLSPKTNLTLSAYRDFQTYDAGVNTTVGTGLTAGVAWSPTRRLSTTFDTQFAWSTIDGVPIGRVIGQREDLVRTFSVGVNYSAWRRIALRTYATRLVRDSTVRSAVFSGTTFGLALTATFD